MALVMHDRRCQRGMICRIALISNTAVHAGPVDQTFCMIWCKVEWIHQIWFRFEWLISDH